MKKIILVLVAVVMGSMAMAQSNAIGIRFNYGDGSRTGYELSWQHGLGANRMELDLGTIVGDNGMGFNLTGTYLWNGTFTGGFGWFAGVGAQVGFWNFDNGGFALALVGQAGLEYKFSAIPLQITLDLRPTFNFLPYSEFHWGGVTGGLRYTF